MSKIADVAVFWLHCYFWSADIDSQGMIKRCPKSFEFVKPFQLLIIDQGTRAQWSWNIQRRPFKTMDTWPFWDWIDMNLRCLFNHIYTYTCVCLSIVFFKCVCTLFVFIYYMHIPHTPAKWKMLICQWPFQEPKLEVPIIYKAYIRPM